MIKGNASTKVPPGVAVEIRIGLIDHFLLLPGALIDLPPNNGSERKRILTHIVDGMTD